jgi:maltose alpha-D-glucosyltransferase / alpha-amylase
MTEAPRFSQGTPADCRYRALLPQPREDLRVLLEALLLDKAFYELGYELNNRPDWLPIPPRGIVVLVEGPSRW